MATPHRAQPLPFAAGRIISRARRRRASSPRAASSLQLCLYAFVVVALFLLTVPGASAQFDTTLSAPVGDPVSQSLYSESATTGPSSSLLPGGSNLTLPSVKAGISDPLGFLIDTGSMSPYLPGGSMAESYAQAEVSNLVLNDPILALRFGEYRNNRILMAGAAAANTPSGRVSTSGSTFGGVSGARSGMAGGGDRGAASLRPFAAGSSVLSSQAIDGQGEFLDPNALVAAARSNPSATAGYSTGSSEGGGISGLAFDSSVSSASSDLDALSASSAGAMVMSAPSVGFTPGLLVDGGADAMPLGASPGHVFPQFSAATNATSGFPDSTMGTGGQAESFDLPDISPLTWSQASGEEAPFAEMSSETTSFLHPSLRGGLVERSKRQPRSIEDIARSMRQQALARNPNAAMPSVFAQRTMKRNYERRVARSAGATGSRTSKVRLSTEGLVSK